MMTFITQPLNQNKMTAVEFLEKELFEKFAWRLSDVILFDELIAKAKEMEEDGKHKAYLYGHKVGFMKAKKPTPIVENKTKNCKKEYNGKGRQAPPPPLHSKTRTK